MKVNYKIDCNNVIQDIRDIGYSKLPDIREFFDLEKFGQLISSQIGNKNFYESSSYHMEIIERLELKHSLIPVLYEYAKNKLGYDGSISNQYHIARKVEPGDSKECYRAHFDSHLFTIVFPLLIPKNRENLPVGELLIFPNIRKNPSNEFNNLLTKLWYKKYASENGIKKLSERHTMKTINFQDYCPLIFRGNTFLHTNKELSPNLNSNRITCLSHFFDPFSSFGVGTLLRKIRSR